MQCQMGPHAGGVLGEEEEGGRLERFPGGNPGRYDLVAWLWLNPIFHPKLPSSQQYK